MAKMALEALSAEKKFIEKSQKAGIDEQMAYLPESERWDIVKQVNFNHWHKDDFFAFEIFNGCNPFSVETVTNIDDIQKEWL